MSGGALCRNARLRDAQRLGGLFESSAKLFAAATIKPILGAFSAPIPKPEHLLAMKALAMKNSPQRVLIDSPDVQFLLRLPGVDRAEVRDYFARHGLLELFDAIDERSRP